MQTISADLSAGVKQVFGISDAEFFMLLETEAALDVELFEADGGRSELAQGVESGYREKVAPGQDKLNRVELTSSVAQTVKFGHSARDVDNRKVTSTVSVVSGEKETSISGYAYFGGSNVTATAAQYSYSQLWNPVASGKRLIVDAVTASISVATYVQLLTYGTQLSSGAGDDPQNKLIGGAASIALLREQKSASGLGTQFARRDMAADRYGEFFFAQPIVVPEGQGLMAKSGVVNASMFIDYQFVEESI